MLIHKIIRRVSCSFSPMDDEVSLADAVPHPVTFYVVGLRASMFHVIVGESLGTLVFYLQDCWWLWVDY